MEGIVELKAMGNSDGLADKSGEIADGEIIDPSTVLLFIDDGF